MPVVVGALAELSIECKEDKEEFAADDEEKTVTCKAPIATPKGGTLPYNVNPGANLDISITGTPTTTQVFQYTVTDAEGCMETCSVALSILPGEIIYSNKGITGDTVRLQFGVVPGITPHPGLSSTACASFASTPPQLNRRALKSISRLVFLYAPVAVSSAKLSHTTISGDHSKYDQILLLKIGNI